MKSASNLKDADKIIKAVALNPIKSACTDTAVRTGKRMSLSQFKKWIAAAEQVPAVSLEEAKSIWSGKRKQLQKMHGAV